MLKRRQNEVKRNIFLFDEVKKHSRTSPDEQFKEFSLTKQTSRPKTDYERTGKTILKKKSDQKNFKKNRKSMSKCRMSKKFTSQKWKFGSYKKLGLEWTMNGLGKPFRKKSDPKNWKNSKNQSENAACEQKSLARKRIFVQTPFSCSTLKLEQKKFHAAKPLAFSLHFLFRRDQNHHSNLTSKIMKMCEQILKKKHSRTSPDAQFKEFSLT